MYIRKAALHYDAKELAQLCHCDVRTFKRVTKSLIGRGRIVHDEENGLLYDERTIRELVKAGFFSEEQTARAMTRWNGVTPPRVVVDETARSDLPSNVAILRPEQTVAVSQVLHKVGAKLMETRVDNEGSTERDQSVRGENAHATQYPLPIAHPQNLENPDDGERSSCPRRSPLNRGGAASAPRQAKDRQQWLADQAAALGVTTRGKEEEPIGASPDEALDEFQPGDKTARRT